MTYREYENSFFIYFFYGTILLICFHCHNCSYIQKKISDPTINLITSTFPAKTAIHQRNCHLRQLAEDIKQLFLHLFIKISRRNLRYCAGGPYFREDVLINQFLNEQGPLLRPWSLCRCRRMTYDMKLTVYKAARIFTCVFRDMRRGCSMRKRVEVRCIQGVQLNIGTWRRSKLWGWYGIKWLTLMTLMARCPLEQILVVCNRK